MSALPAQDRLIDVPDVGAALKRDWPRILNRVIAAILIPVSGASLLHAMGMIGVITPYVPGIWFLAPAATTAYAWRVMAFLIFVLVLGAFFLQARMGGAIIAIALGVTVTASFNHSSLHWTELFQMTAETGTYLEDTPSVAAWGWGVALFAAVGMFLLVEANLDAQRQQGARGLPEEETKALAAVGRRGIAFAALLALGIGAALFAASTWLDPLARGQLLANRLNPVVLLLVLGVGLAVAVVLAGRRARVGAEARGDERTVRVPVQGPPER